MTRTMIYLPDELHKHLKHLAVERNTSMTELLREAAEILCQEDLDDLRTSQKRLQSYFKNPQKAIPYEQYKIRRLKRAS